ncbi:MAG: response regulator [Chloroflexota bacterium]
MITIALADDHQIVRKGLVSLLEGESDFRVVAEAGNGLEVIQLVERFRPDVLVMDIVMPGLSGLDAARQVLQRSPQTRIIILSMHADEPYILDALKSGVSGYVLKDSTTDELTLAIRSVAAGRRYLSSDISERAIDLFVQMARDTTLDPYDTLTDRECEVLHLTAEGLNNPEIAARLSLSTRTVETHRANLMHKLALGSQTDLIRYALRKKLIT